MRRTLVALALVTLAACGGGSRGAKQQPAAAPPSTAPPTTMQPTVSAAGARLTPPKSPTNKPPDAAPNCPSLVDAGFEGSCRLATGPHAISALVDESQQEPAGNEHRLLVWRKTSEGFSLALRYSEASGGSIAYATVNDLAQDQDPKIVVTYHDAINDGTSGEPTLSGIDVAETGGTVVLHEDLSHGQAAPATGGGLETWSRVDGTSPLRYRHQVIRYHDGDWRIEKDEQVPAESVPKPDPKTGNVFT